MTNSITNDVPAELQSFVEQLPGARIVMDRDYRIVAANRQYRENYAHGAEVVGRRCYEVSHGYDASCDLAGESCPRRLALESGHMARVVHMHHTPRGDEHVQVELHPLRDAAGRVRLFVEHMESLPSASAARSAEGSVS